LDFLVTPLVIIVTAPESGKTRNCGLLRAQELTTMTTLRPHHHCAHRVDVISEVVGLAVVALRSALFAVRTRNLPYKVRCMSVMSCQWSIGRCSPGRYPPARVSWHPSAFTSAPPLSPIGGGVGGISRAYLVPVTQAPWGPITPNNPLTSHLDGEERVGAAMARGDGWRGEGDGQHDDGDSRHGSGNGWARRWRRRRLR